MILNKSDENSSYARIDALKNGKIVIIPTDTVYGFSGIVLPKNPLDGDAKIKKIKGRAETKPFIQLIATPEDIKKYTDDEIPSELLSYWPGPLTIIVNNKNESLDGLKTIAFRCPGDEWLRNIIAGTGAPIYSTSVNRSGNPVLDTEAAIKAEFEKDVDLIVLDGDKKSAVPSTIVSVAGGEVKVLRQGAVKI